MTTALPAHAQESTSLNLGPNLVKNASFEDKTANWNIPTDTAKAVQDHVHSGEYSLYYNNTDAKQYKLFAQGVDVKPGQRLYFSAWVKGENVTLSPKEGGAALYMESNSGRQFASGAYPRGMTGTFDWTQVKGEYIVPPSATGTAVGLYLRPGSTGEVWFDDVEVREVLPDQVTSWLQYPNYRGTVKYGDKTPWVYRLRLNQQEDAKQEKLNVSTTLIDAQGKVLLQQKDAVDTAQKEAQITIQPPRNLPIGKYALKQIIAGVDGKEETQSSDQITIVEKMPKVYIDAQGFTVVDGKRFFPMGVFLGGENSDDENLRRVAEGGFNTVLSYLYGVYQYQQRGMEAKEYMKSASRYNLKVIYDINRLYSGVKGFGDEADDIAADYIRNWRDDPALLAWYINDEMGAEWLPKMRHRYEQIRQLDVNHPTYHVQNQWTELEDNAKITDVLGVDPYPVGNPNLRYTSFSTKRTVAAGGNAKGIWMAPQIMDWAVYRKDSKPHQPSLDEMRNQAYQCLINGATGLIWYSYFDLWFADSNRKNDKEVFDKRWPDVVAMTKEINQITPVILEDKKVLLDIPANAEIEAAAWQDGNELVIMFANPYYEEKSVTFALPDGWEIKDANQGEIKSTFASGKATFTLPSVGSGVFRLVQEK